MNVSVLHDAHTLRELTYRLAESFYEENQIFLAQQRIAKLRSSMDKERLRIAQWRTVIHRRKEQERHRKETQKRSAGDAGDE